MRRRLMSTIHNTVWIPSQGRGVMHEPAHQGAAEQELQQGREAGPAAHSLHLQLPSLPQTPPLAPQVPLQGPSTSICKRSGMSTAMRAGVGTVVGATAAV